MSITARNASPMHLGVMHRFSFTLSKDFTNAHKRALSFVFTLLHRRHLFAVGVVVVFTHIVLSSRRHPFRVYALLFVVQFAQFAAEICGDFRALHSSLRVGNGSRNDEEEEERRRGRRQRDFFIQS